LTFFRRIAVWKNQNCAAFLSGLPVSIPKEPNPCKIA
jgi:hypothetical protein